ncbi:MAG: ATP synthase epsilon chain [Parcubacteria group bacterium GW2011_GWB1_44_7]|nr:MAG: ATP synthase epsilon chain [Parcubacteria group bacterium GW2011_GWB1_44_7]
MLLFIYSLDKKLFEGEASQVTLPSDDGEITILSGHATLASSLKSGQIKIQSAGQKEETFSVKSGFAYTDGKETIVFSRD